MKNKNLVSSSKVVTKAISPLIISEGLIHGWAFDPLRPVLEVTLRVDGVELASGLTGHAVADEFYAQHTPPNARCGFVIALPKQAMDGFNHQLSIKVTEWRVMPLSPEVTQEWCYGDHFGEVKYTPEGYIEGWVGFKTSVDPDKLPPIIVSEHNQKRFVIQLSPMEPCLAGCLSMGQFSVQANQFGQLEAPAFSCLDVDLRIQTAATAFKPVGQVEDLDYQGIRGWVINSINPAETVDLLLVVDGLPLRAIRPNVRRDNIAEFLKLLPEEIGLAGFRIGLPAKLKDGRPHKVSVHCRKDGTVLNETPLTYQHVISGLELNQAQALLGKATRRPGFSLQSSDADSFGKSPRDSDNPLVSVIILNRNGANCLDTLFSSWQRYNRVASELIVFDHASTDESLAVINRWSTQLVIRIVALDYNESFSASCNQGARLAKAPYILFLNNDIVWLQDALTPMLDTLKDPEVAVVGLKLLKTDPTEIHGKEIPVGSAEVQHLGVRYTLSGNQYLPHEASPDSYTPEQLHSPQAVLMVTGAVMLCRRVEFLAIGGFNENYFYGYEDVEFCLRMSVQQGKRIICRNDLLALHHHGYTRLTGREPSVIERQFDNQRHLASQLGLWVKRAFWQGLLQKTNLLGNESLTVGFVMENYHSSQQGKAQLAAAVDMAEAICAMYPATKTRFLMAESDWYMVSGLHVLIAFSPYYDLRNVSQVRTDLRSAFYLDDTRILDSWLVNPSLELFDVCLCQGMDVLATAKNRFGELARSVLTTPQAPLADLLVPERLRILIRTSANPSLQMASQQLSRALKAQGALVRETDTAFGKERARIAEVVITLHGEPINAIDPVPEYQRRYDAINVLWIIEDVASLRVSEVEQFDQVWLAIPELPLHLHHPAFVQRAVGLQPELMQGLVQQLTQVVEKRIERSFHPS